MRDLGQEEEGISLQKEWNTGETPNKPYNEKPLLVALWASTALGAALFIAAASMDNAFETERHNQAPLENTFELWR